MTRTRRDARSTARRLGALCPDRDGLTDCADVEDCAAANVVCNAPD